MNNKAVEITSERIDDIPVVVEWLKQMEIAKWIDKSLSKPHGNHQGMSYGQLSVFLVVDDEVAIGELIKTTLETYNYRVITANDGASAIAIYADRQQEIASVLIDMMMPVVDGLTTVATLRKINPDLPIVAMSGLKSTESLERAERFGCHYFLAKPFTVNDLLQTIRNCHPNDRESNRIAD